jgi:hypothetical protein
VAVVEGAAAAVEEAVAVALRGEEEAEEEGAVGAASRSVLRTLPMELTWAKVSSTAIALRIRCRGSELTNLFQPRHALLAPTAKKIKANLIANAKTKKRFFKSIAGEEGFVDTKGKRRANDDEVEDDDEDRSDKGERSSAPRRPRAGPSSRGAPSPFFQKPDLGRFAREEEEQEADGPKVDSAASRAARDDSRQRRRDRAGPAPGPDGEDKRDRRHARPEETSSALRPPVAAKPSLTSAPASGPTQTSAPRPHRTREEAVEARKKRQEMWNSTSKGGSRAQSRKGGQPDLGKRMQVLLGRIEERQ